MVSGPDSTLDCADVCASTASRFGSPAPPDWPVYAARPGLDVGLGGTSGADFLPVSGARNRRVIASLNLSLRLLCRHGLEVATLGLLSESTMRMSLPSSPLLPPPPPVLPPPRLSAAAAEVAPLAGGSGLTLRRVVEEALEEMLLTSAAAVALHWINQLGHIQVA